MPQSLAELIAKHCPVGLHQTAIPRLHLARIDAPSEPMHGVQNAAFCLIAQGSKRVMLGGQVLDYDAETFLLASVDLPIVGQVTGATPEAPYLSLRLDFDPALLSALVLEAGEAATPGGSSSGVSVDSVQPEMLDAAARLVALLDRPEDIPILAPLVERELLYRLLRGPQGARLRQIALADAAMHRVGRAIAWIKSNYNAPFSIEALAAEARMSPSALHHHFKAVTAMSPLQYQKQLRLQEARRLILARSMDAATAAFNVGYESPSQFSREYSRLFGAPPVRDTARLRAGEAGGAVAA